MLRVTLSLLKPVQESLDKGASFVDCLTMASADFYGTREIFGFDAVIVHKGFHYATSSGVRTNKPIVVDVSRAPRDKSRNH